MTIAVTEEHRQLAATVAGWAERHVPMSLTRATLAGQRPDPALVEVLGAQGLLGLHLAEAAGGSGYGPVEAAIVLEGLGRALAPLPALPTILASALLVRSGADVAEPLARLAAGTAVGAVAWGRDAAAPVLGAPEADLLIVPVGSAWALAPVGSVGIEALDAFDPTRTLGTVTAPADASGAVALPELDRATVMEHVVALVAAEAAGVAAWCLESATEYAKVREQFGRPIGQFQAVKHLCADMLVRVEQARAAAWDAAAALADDDQRPLASAVAAAVATDAAVSCAEDCIQILGGIGFTWEHDAHLYLRRATVLRALVGGGDAWRRRVATLALRGVRRDLELQLPAEVADRHRVEVRTFVAGLPTDEDARRRALTDAGYVVPHWPRPWGRDAGAVEQLVIDEEFAAAGVRRPNLVIGGWILPTIIHHGTDEQRERFIRPTLNGEITWCQMFSEPGAGSDLAALSTRATRVEGGWALSGQKVWTSLAHRSDWSLCLARTDPDAPKHEGITAFLVDMRSEGLDIRPLREITGRSMFNEIFLDGVFVPDELVCGPVGGGWKAARTTLANERVAMSSGSSMGAGVEEVLAAVSTAPSAADGGVDPVLLDRVGGLVVEGQVLALLGLRTTLAQLSGSDPGASSSVRKLVGGEHTKACTGLVLELADAQAAVASGRSGEVATAHLQAQCLTIAGGTTAVQRNVVAERLLGLPRDP